MKWIVIIVAMVCITGLEVLAMFKGINGITFSLCVAAVAGLGGFKVKDVVDKIKGGKK